MVFVHIGISPDGFVAAVSRGPHNTFGHMGDEGPRVDVPRRGQGHRDRVVSLKRLHGIGSTACEGEVLEVPREQRVRPTNLRAVRMTERTSPSIATVGRDVEEGAAASNGGAVLWAE